MLWSVCGLYIVRVKVASSQVKVQSSHLFEKYRFRGFCFKGMFGGVLQGKLHSLFLLPQLPYYYAVAMNWIRYWLSFALLRAATSIMPIRGAHYSLYHSVTESPIDFSLLKATLVSFKYSLYVLWTLVPCILFVTDVTPNVGTLFYFSLTNTALPKWHTLFLHVILYHMTLSCEILSWKSLVYK